MYNYITYRFLIISLHTCLRDDMQWLKCCNGMQGNAVPPPPIYSSKRSSTSDCYNARERYTTTHRGPKRTVPPPLILHWRWRSPTAYNAVCDSIFKGILARWTVTGWQKRS